MEGTKKDPEIGDGKWERTGRNATKISRRTRPSYSHASPKTVKERSEDYGIHKNLLYDWRWKYTSDANKTKYATLKEENRALRRELAETRLKRGM